MNNHSMESIRSYFSNGVIFIGALLAAPGLAVIALGMKIDPSSYDLEKLMERKNG